MLFISTLIHFWLFFYIVDSYPMLYSIASASHIFLTVFARDILRVLELSGGIYPISVGLSLPLVILPLPPSFVSTINANDLFQVILFLMSILPPTIVPCIKSALYSKTEFCSKDPDNSFWHPIIHHKPNIKSLALWWSHISLLGA